MRPRRSPRRGAIEDLRRVIDCLPRETRLAMLDAVREEPIIAGAYTDGHGGMCPMLAAHRRGGRTSQLAFAHAWDRVVGARRGPRRVGSRERALLVAHLEASLDAETVDLAAAIEEHRALVQARLPPALGGRPALRAEDWADVLAALEGYGEPRIRRAAGVV